jgi:hypothetical protein
MKCAFKALVLFTLFVAETISRGQNVVTNDDLLIRFPTADWRESQAPAQLKNAFSTPGIPLRLRFHSVSPAAKLRFYITQFDYPAGPKEQILAGFLDGVRQRCARQASDEVKEQQGEKEGLPYRTFSCNAPNNYFLAIRVYMAADHAYTLEISGPREARVEAERCLEGVVITGTRNMAPAVEQRIKEIRTTTRSTSEAYGKGRRIGYAVGFMFGGIIIIGAPVLVLVILLSRKRTHNPPVIRQTISPQPPPLPPPGVRKE